MIGSQAGQSATSTDASTIIGYQAAGGAALTGDYNTAIGYQSGYALVGGVEGSVLLGHRAGYGATSGGYNTFLGYAAGQNVTTGAGNVAIGKNAGPSSTNTDSNKLYIHNAAGTPLIGGDFASSAVTINGALGVTGSLSVTGSSLAVQKEMKNDLADGATISTSYSHYQLPIVTGMDGPGVNIQAEIITPANPRLGDEYWIVSAIGDGPGAPFAGCAGTAKIRANSSQKVNDTTASISLVSHTSTSTKYNIIHLICVDASSGAERWACTVSAVGPT
jgi:hypothetical protein